MGRETYVRARETEGVFLSYFAHAATASPKRKHVCCLLAHGSTDNEPSSASLRVTTIWAFLGPAAQCVWASPIRPIDKRKQPCARLRAPWWTVVHTGTAT